MNDSCSMFSSRFLVDIFLYFIIFGDLFGVSLTAMRGRFRFIVAGIS